MEIIIDCPKCNEDIITGNTLDKILDKIIKLNEMDSIPPTNNFHKKGDGK